MTTEQAAIRGGLTRTLAVALALVALGCTANDSNVTTSAADCSSQVRLAGVLYTSSGYTQRNATRYSAADVAECHDEGQDAAGSVFPERPRQVMTWAFRGYPREKVVGVRFDQKSFEVFVADSLPSVERERIFRQLGRPPAGVMSHTPSG